MNKKWYLGIIVACCLTNACLANDGAMGLESGNIVFKKADGIAMLSEDLYISPEKTRVKYEFANLTSADVTTIVGFPIPGFPLDDDGDTSFDTSSDNPLQFETRVDGRHVNARLIRKERDGKAEFTYTWEQTFPAGRTLTVEHQYMTAPSMGFYGYDPEASRRYCVEKGAEAAINKMGESPRALYVSYILKTAATWQGPIRDFRLVIDKLKKDRIVSFCAEGVKKIGPTLFEIVKKDYSPVRDIDILFVER